jgi:hypothetical protein
MRENLHRRELIGCLELISRFSDSKLENSFETAQSHPNQLIYGHLAQRID